MIISADAVDAYSIAILAGAPYAHSIAHSLFFWPLIFFIFSLPALNLFINLGFVSGAGPVLTFARIAPVSAGIGWALTWLVGERLYRQSLNAAQNLLYFIYSIRRRLDWAVDCNHSRYNNADCAGFLTNVTYDNATHWPENNWAAQQFNRYGVRGVAVLQKLTEWSPNAWYFGERDQTFSFQVFSFPLVFCHFLVWGALFLIVHRYGTNPGKFLSRFCYLLPLVLFALLDIGLAIFGFNFRMSSEREISPFETEANPVEYSSDIHGFYRTSLLLIDYSSAFTGIILFASSRIRSASTPMSAIAVVVGQMFAPILLYVLRQGCSGHLKEKQTVYESYLSTEAAFSFDSAAVCFATSSGGPFWALLYYAANLMYSCIGPMTIFLLFIYNVFLEQFPFLERFATHLLATICSIFAVCGILLVMPMGTVFAAFFTFVSQSSITQIFTFVVVVFVYGWYNLDSDMRLMLSSAQNYRSLLEYFIGPTSPIYTVLLLTTVPALLAAKFASVFDLLMSGRDVARHIKSGTSSLTGSAFINHFIGYSVMFGPLMIVIAFAIFAFYKTAVVYKMVAQSKSSPIRFSRFSIKHLQPWGSMLDPTADWHSNFSLRQAAVPRPAPLSHSIFTSLTKMSYRTALFVIFILEAVFGVILFLLFFTNVIWVHFKANVEDYDSNVYRCVMYIVFATFHLLALLEIRWALKKWDHSSRLNLCIANSTMEMAFLNGYMWSSAMNHTWGFQWIQFLVVFVNTSIRGAIIAVLIAIRWNMAEQSHPTHIRDATEIYDATADLDNDLDREDNAPIIYEMHRDVFT